MSMAQLPIIDIATETAAAMFNLGTYGDCGPELLGLTWGMEDLATALGAQSNRDAQGRPTAPYDLARTLCLIGARAAGVEPVDGRSEEHTSELQSRPHLVCRLLL